MIKSLRNSILVLVIYFATYFGIERLLKFLFLREVFADTNPDYFLFIDPVLSLLFIILLLSIFRKRNSFSIEKPKIKYVVVICVLAISFFILKEPFLRRDLIWGNITIPEIIADRPRSFIDLFASFLSIVILTPIFEELLFRKILLSFFSKKHLFVGVISSSLIFASIHIKFNDIDLITLMTLFCFGLIACLLYIRYGILSNVLFHIISNLIWFCIDTNRLEYWEVLRVLDFSLLYWLIVIISFCIFSYFTYVLISQIITINRSNSHTKDASKI
ncbi:MAG: CPBP family intramembrane glutamic endopeptidase [Winogradskyella sp.]